MKTLFWSAVRWWKWSGKSATGIALKKKTSNSKKKHVNISRNADIVGCLTVTSPEQRSYVLVCFVGSFGTTGEILFPAEGGRAERGH